VRECPLVTSGGDGALPEPVPGVRATDGDRQRAIARLRTAAGEGAIDLDELEQRIAAAYEARSLPELAELTADLPAPVPAPGATPPPHRSPIALEDDEFRQHLTSYCLVMALLLVIWLAAGAHFPWPFIVAAAWGVGLGSHYQVASTHQRKRLARATAEGITLDELERIEARERKQKRSDFRHEAFRQAERAMERLPKAPPLPPLPPLSGRPTPGRTRPEPEPAAPATRFVVAMFVDVVGSTTLNEALGDEQWASVRRAFRSVVTEAVEAHGGWEVSTSGDGVLARFEQPTGAADAAVQILRRLDVQRADTGFAPSVRIGVHSGDAVTEGEDIIGNVVNLACRVSEAADRDEVLVTEHVADHLDRRHTTNGRGLHTLKGIARPRHLLALDWR